MSDLLKTKTFWGGIASVCTGIGLIVMGDVPSGANAIATGLLAIFVRDGVAKVQRIARATQNGKNPQ